MIVHGRGSRCPRKLLQASVDETPEAHSFTPHLAAKMLPWRGPSGPELLHFTQTLVAVKVPSFVAGNAGPVGADAAAGFWPAVLVSAGAHCCRDLDFFCDASQLFLMAAWPNCC